MTSNSRRPEHADTNLSTPIRLRRPSFLRRSSPAPPSSTTIHPPTLSFFTGTWHVTHSTLPMWRKHRNVAITYTPIRNTSSSSAPSALADKVTYQTLTSRKIKVVAGIDKAINNSGNSSRITSSSKKPSLREAEEEEQGEGKEEKEEELVSLHYHWRGTGLLFIASSKWEILGYGVEESPKTNNHSTTTTTANNNSSNNNQWIVTFFAKTLFTPIGMDIYSRDARGLHPETVEGIIAALKNMGGEVERLAGEIFELLRDGNGESESEDLRR